MLNLSRLSVEQRAVVCAADGPLLVLAGPGSGKTTVLTARIAYLVAARKVTPSSILALTFATKAAREIRNRLVAILGAEGAAVDVATLHAFGLRVIRQWSLELGLGLERPIVYDASDARALLAELAQDPIGTSGRWSLADLTRLVERHRLGDETVRAGSPDQIRLVAEAYEAILQRRRAIDYAAMLALPLRLFTEYPAALRFLQHAYRYVLVDEFQDVCGAQYRLVQQLGAVHRNLLAVGDPLQTVFSWRGADVRFVGAFQQDFPEARVVGLDHNFRSTGHIVDLANALGKPLPYHRSLRTDNPIGDPGRLVVTDDENAERRFVVGEIARLRAEARIAGLDDIAILYRTNHQAEDLVLALREQGLPYAVRGANDFFARREVRDAIAYLRLIHDPSDVAALARIVNVPPRGLGRIAAQLCRNPIPLGELARLVQSESARAVGGAQGLIEMVNDLHSRIYDLSPSAILDQVLARSRYRDWLEAQSDGTERLANLGTLAELTSSAGELGELLQMVGDDDALEGTTDTTNRVVLSTIHAAKGGEWRVVFVVGMEEGLLPHHRSLADPSSNQWAIDDERRVAYVAVTRPRELLYLTYCKTRQRGSMVEPRRPSRFLHGLPVERVDPAV